MESSPRWIDSPGVDGNDAVGDGGRLVVIVGDEDGGDGGRRQDLPDVDGQAFAQGTVQG